VNFKKKLGCEPANAGKPCGERTREDFEAMDPELNKALGEFRLSVHAWSEAAYSRPRTAVAPGRRRIWRLAAGWALGGVLLAGGVSAGMWEHHQHQQEMRIAAVRAAEQQRLAAQQREQQARQEKEDLLAKEDVLAKEDLLARVDNDVSREVPAAMEPLGQLMAGDESW
jgi:hypothetical protein